MAMKEKVDKILGGFLERNKEYAVELYIDNAITNSRLGQVIMTADWTFKADDEKLTLEWNIGTNINFNKFSIQYDEIIACYDEIDKYDQQMVYVVLKNGMTIDFGCIGMQI